MPYFPITEAVNRSLEMVSKFEDCVRAPYVSSAGTTSDKLTILVSYGTAQGGRLARFEYTISDRGISEDPERIVW